MEEARIPKDWPVVLWAIDVEYSLRGALRYRGLELPHRVAKMQLCGREQCGVSWCWEVSGGELVSISIFPDLDSGWRGVMADSRTGEMYQRPIPAAVALDARGRSSLTREWSCWLRGRIKRIVGRGDVEAYERAVIARWGDEAAHDLRLRGQVDLAEQIERLRRAQPSGGHLQAVQDEATEVAASQALATLRAQREDDGPTIEGLLELHRWLLEQVRSGVCGVIMPQTLREYTSAKMMLSAEMVRNYIYDPPRGLVLQLPTPPHQINVSAPVTYNNRVVDE